jgi:NADPH2:quinone reductase
VPSQKGSLFLTRPLLFHYIDARDDLAAAADEVFAAVRGGVLRVDVNQTFPHVT